MELKRNKKESGYLNFKILLKKIMPKISAVCILIAALFISACGAGPSENNGASGTSDNGSLEETGKDEAVTAQDTSLRTVTDVWGRVVEVPQDPQSTAALGGAARLLTYAGCADKITGLSDLEKEGDFGMPFAYVNRELFASCASVSSGGSGDTVYEEALAVLNPDIIFYMAPDADTLDRLQKKLGIPVVGLYATNFYDDDFIFSLELAGEIMGTSEHVEELVNSLRAWISDLDDRTGGIPDEEKPLVYTGALSFKGSHGFDGTSANFPPFLAVNAKNAADETGEEETFLVDLEQVAVWDPDYIFLNPLNMNLVNEDYKANGAYYESLKAVRNGNVYSMVSYNYFKTNQELAIADAYYAGSIIYPGAFSDISFEEKAGEIFNLMLGQDYINVLNENGASFGKLIIGG